MARLDAASRAETLERGQSGVASSRLCMTSVCQTATATSGTTGSTRTTNLMEEVLRRENLIKALKRVRGNQGAAGIDGMTVNDLGAYLRESWPRIREELLSRSYEPQPVRVIKIPKPSGGKRMLGIPTVLDRLIQQAVLQVIGPIFEPTFSDSSFGFRPGRSAHQALSLCRDHIAAGYRFVVDLDLENFFDRVNHDILMSRLARRIGDKRLLSLIRSFLTAGMMEGGIVSSRSAGTPQGSPLSPLLSNVLLDDLDKELEKRGHRFARYADDANVYVGSLRAGELCADLADSVLGAQASSSGQSRQERRGSTLEAQVSRVLVHGAQEASSETVLGIRETVQGSGAADR